jgi:hypothetical protein
MVHCGHAAGALAHRCHPVAAVRGGTCRSCRLILTGARPHNEAVAKPHIDRSERAIEQRVLLLQLHQASDCLDLMTFRQHHISAVVEPQVPATLADTHRGGDALLQIWMIR